MTAPTAIQLRDELVPGSPEWLQTVSASQIATIIGINPWQTPFELWQRKAGITPQPAQTGAQTRGHEFEPLIFRWVAEKHPDWDVQQTGTWRHKHRDWQTCNPDGLIVDDTDHMVLEIKTTHDIREWDRSGVPDYYQAQAQWQLDVLGLEKAVFAVCGPFELIDRNPKTYTVQHDPHVCQWLRDQAQRFTESLILGIAPDPDHNREGDRIAVCWQHPTISEGPAPLTLPDELAIEWLEAADYKTRYGGRKSAAASRIVAYMGEAKSVEWRGVVLGSRRNGRNGNPPYFAAAKGIADRIPDLLATPREETAS